MKVKIILIYININFIMIKVKSIILFSEKMKKNSSSLLCNRIICF